MLILRHYLEYQKGLQLEEWPPADKLMKLGVLWSSTLFSGVNLVLEALEAQLVMGKGGRGGHKV